MKDGVIEGLAASSRKDVFLRVRRTLSFSLFSSFLLSFSFIRTEEFSFSLSSLYWDL